MWPRHPLRLPVRLQFPVRLQLPVRGLEMKRPRQGPFRLELQLPLVVLFLGRLRRNLCPVKYLQLLQLLQLKGGHRIRLT